MLATAVLSLLMIGAPGQTDATLALVEKLLASTSVEERMSGVKELASLPAGERVAQLLMRAVGDAAPDIRRFAVETLGWRGSDLDAAVRPEWKWRLGEQVNRYNRQRWQSWQEGLVGLLSACTKDESLTVQLAAFRALARLARPLSGLGQLWAAECGTVSERYLSWKAEDAFNQHAESQTAKIDDLLADDEPQLVYAAVCHWPESPRTRAALHRFLTESRAEWRAMAAERLGNEKQRPHEELERLLTDSSELVRNSAIGAISDAKDEYLANLLSRIPNPSPMMKLSIVSIAEHVNDRKRFAGVMTRYCFDSNPKVREAALRLARSYWLVLPQELLARYLHDSNEGVRLHAIELFVRDYREDAWAHLNPLLRDRSQSVRNNAFDAMCRVASPEDIDYLLAEFRRAGAGRFECGLYGLIGANWSSGLITSLLHDRDVGIRRLAADVIRNRTAPDQIDPSLWRLVIKATQDPDAIVRQKAVHALSDSQISGAFEAAVRLLKDPSTKVRAEAISAVAAIDGKRALPLIKPFVNDPDDDIARTATTEHARLEKGDDEDLDSSIPMGP